jgi:hypothetical protein
LAIKDFSKYGWIIANSREIERAMEIVKMIEDNWWYSAALANIFVALAKAK